MPLQPALATLAQQLPTSRIAGLSRLAHTMPHVLNLGEGYPDFDLHPALQQALQQVAAQRVHHHTDGRGLPVLRQWIADYLPGPLCPNDHVTVTCGATQALAATWFALLNPGDEVVVFEPFYEPYLAMIRLAGGVPRCVPLQPPHWDWDNNTLAQAITPRTRAVLLNSPHNPTGKVFSPAACDRLAQLAQCHGLWLVHDAVYSDWCDPAHPMAWLTTWLPQQTITISSFSKSLGITGWRVGYVVAPTQVTHCLRNLHELQTCEAPVPLQAAIAQALPSIPLHNLFTKAAPYRQALQALLTPLEATVFKPQGGIYTWAALPPHWGNSPAHAAKQLLTKQQVLAIPAESFYQQAPSTHWLRWCWAKQKLLTAYTNFCFK
jgi:aspartate/methionine/tyrosine aminotransferase